MGTGSGKWTVDDGKSDGRKELGIWKAVAERWIFRNDGMNPAIMLGLSDVRPIRLPSPKRGIGVFKPSWQKFKIYIIKKRQSDLHEF